MNILKDVTVKGDIFSEYAFLSYTFSFESSDEVSAEYTFSLPKNSLISSVKLFYNNRIIETKIASASHTAMLLKGGEALATLLRVKNDEYILSIGSLDESGLKLMLSVYSPISESRLSIPLARKGSGGSIASHTAQINLNALTAHRVTSPTHQLMTETTEDRGIKISSGKITPTKDFAIEILEREKSNAGILQKGITGGELLFKFYPNTPMPLSQKLLFIYDGISSKTASVMARDFIFYSIKNHSDKFAIATADTLLTNGYIDATDEALDSVLYKLSHIEPTFGEWTEALKYADKDTSLILLTENPDIYDREQLKNLHIVTFGAVSSFGYHIYPNENIENRAKNIIKNILYAQSLKSCKIEPFGGEAYLIDCSYEKGITAYIRYTGAFPKKLTLSYGEHREEQTLDNIKVYDSFSPIGLICAGREQRLLYERLKTCSPEDVSHIRKEIEEVGLKYSALNSETALMGSLDKKTTPIRVIIPNEADLFSENTVSMFRERTSAPDKDFICRCILYIIRNMRSDGAICTDGEINLTSRISLTKTCLAALIIADTNIDLTGYIKKAEEFISYGFKSKQEAYDYLTSIFKTNEVIPKEIQLDLITCAKVIWQN